MGKLYAVRTGRKIGIFTNWQDCELQVKGYPGAQYKSFFSRIEAEVYLNDSKTKSTELSEDNLRVYVDGSYSESQKRAGFGCVFVRNETILKEVYKETLVSSNDNLWNVSAEIAGVLYAIEWCIKKRYLVLIFIMIMKGYAIGLMVLGKLINKQRKIMWKK